jgi:hypothetical protein
MACCRAIPAGSVPEGDAIRKSPRIVYNVGLVAEWNRIGEWRASILGSVVLRFCGSVFWSATMERFDPETRARVVRVAIALLAVVVVSALIGLSVGRPSGAPGAAAQPTTGASTLPAATAPPSPTPSSTPVPVPTSPPATLVPNDGWLIRSRETFDSTSSWPVQQQPGWAAGYEGGRYWLKLDGQRTISYRIPLDATEFRVSADVQVRGGYAGLVFLSSEPNILYRFQIDNAGRYRLGRRQGADVTTFIDWTAAAALKTGPDAVNQLEVRRVEDEISLFANGIRLATYPLPEGVQFTTVVGMTLDAVAPDSVAMAYFDNLVVRVPEVPAAP